MRALPLVILTALTACNTGTQDLDVLEGAGDHTASPKIYGGSAPDSAHHDAVVGLHQLTKRSVYTLPFCTGTLIADDVVLTAAHCLDDAKGGSTFKTMSPSKVAVYVGDDPRVDLVSHLYTVTETEIYSGYDRYGLTGDIALIRLSSTPTEGITPVEALPSSLGFASSDVGTTLNFAGFGEIEDGSWGGKLQVDLPLGGLGCSVSYCPDAGDSSSQISYSQTSGDGPCSGDSGGPAFIQRSGTWYVGGITSYGDASCLYYGVSTRVDAFEDFISDFTGGTVDTGPVDTGPVDTGPVDPGTCGDGVCGTGESCDGRDGTTTCASDCDGVTKGKPSGRYCYVEGACEGAGCP